MKIKLPTMKCLRCGHEWHPKKEVMPLRCAKCKTPYWNRKKGDAMKNSLMDTWKRSMDMEAKEKKIQRTPYQDKEVLSHERVVHKVTEEYMQTNGRIRWDCRTCGMFGSYEPISK